LDESGEDIFRAFSLDVTAFLAEDSPAAQVTFERVAVTREQVDQYDVQVSPKGAVQAEALPPDLLEQIVDTALREQTDMEVAASTKHRENEARDRLRDEFERRFGEAA
jgi:hypothetical protein